MALNNLALVSVSSKIEFPEVSWAASAIQQQVAGTAIQQWGVAPGQVIAVETVQDILAGYMPVYISDNLGNSPLAGFHLTASGSPYAYVLSDGNWSISASHECLEMLIDPTGNRLQDGPSLIAGQGPVQYLVEVCDPVNNPLYGIQAGPVRVSDFYLPGYFTANSTPDQCSARQTLTQPLEILPGGYITWYYPGENQWYQANRFAPDGSLSSGPVNLPQIEGSYRERVEYMTLPRINEVRKRSGRRRRSPRLKKLSTAKLREYRKHERSIEEAYRTSPKEMKRYRQSRVNKSGEPLL